MDIAQGMDVLGLHVEDPVSGLSRWITDVYETLFLVEVKPDFEGPVYIVLYGNVRNTDKFDTNSTRIKAGNLTFT